MSRRIASLFGPVNCEAQVCSATAPRDIVIGGMKLSLSDVHSAHVPAAFSNDVMVPGMSPEINVPSTVLRTHDVVIDYANREFTIGEPGTVQFKGMSSKAQINALGLIQIPSPIEGQSYNLALDTGASIKFHFQRSPLQMAHHSPGMAFDERCGGRREYIRHTGRDRAFRPATTQLAMWHQRFEASIHRIVTAQYAREVQATSGN